MHNTLMLEKEKKAVLESARKNGQEFIDFIVEHLKKEFRHADVGIMLQKDSVITERLLYENGFNAGLKRAISLLTH